MTSLSTFCLEGHKGSPKSSTTAKAAQKGLNRLSSSMSCWQQEALPVLSLPDPLQQITTAPPHRHHIPGNDFHSSAFSQRLPPPEDSQLCTNTLGKRQHEFPAPVPLCRTFYLGVWITRSHPSHMERQPLQLPTLAAGPSQLIPVGPSVTPLSQDLVESLNPYHWKGNDVRILLAAHSTPYLPLCTGTYTLTSLLNKH